MYKIIVSQADDGALEVMPLLLPNDRIDLDGKAAAEYLSEHLTTVEAIEALTGLQFFTRPDSITSETLAPAKSAKPDALWLFQSSPNSNLVNKVCRATAELAF
jgi:hypothetical protein